MEVFKFCLLLEGLANSGEFILVAEDSAHSDGEPPEFGELFKEVESLVASFL